MTEKVVEAAQDLDGTRASAVLRSEHESKHEAS